MGKKGKTPKPGDAPQVNEGSFVLPDGSRYSGQWVSGSSGLPVRSGSGTLTAADGVTTYNGSWDTDRPQGKGVLTAQDGSTYEGMFVDGKFEGAGKYTWADGSSFQGPWSKGRISGAGVFTSATGVEWVGDPCKASLDMKIPVT
eukprot:m.109999 g.109999  ORF g.109999 m.109999 type:complete len:144 (-) comp16012_c0_seq2:43-474(-)